MKAVSTIRKVGGSLMISLPKEMVKTEGFLAGQQVEIEVRRVRKSFFGITPGIGPFTHEDRMQDRD